MDTTKFYVSCNDQDLRFTTTPVIYSGDVRSCEVIFTFDTNWDNLEKIATFYRDSNEVFYVPLDNNDTCIIPANVTAEVGKLYFAVYGQQNEYEIVKTSSVLGLNIEQGAITPLTDSTEIPADIRAILMNDIRKLQITKKDKYIPYKICNYLYELDFDILNYEEGEQYILEQYPENALGACSSAYKNGIYGRNYDWFYDDMSTFRLHRQPTQGKYESWGVAAGLIKESEIDFSYNKKYEYLPFITLDGFNKKGFACNINILPKKDNRRTTTEFGTGPIRISALSLVRRLLDEAATVDEAIDLIENRYTIVTSPGGETHWMLCDRTKCVVVELEDSGLQVIDSQIMTNFYLDPIPTPEDDRLYPEGVERYNLLASGIDSVQTSQDMADLMQRARYFQVYESLYADNPWETGWKSEFYEDYEHDGVTYHVNIDTRDQETIDYFNNILVHAVLYPYEHKDRFADQELWQTVHSVIYDLNTGIAYLRIQEDFNTVYKFGFDIKADRDDVAAEDNKKVDKTQTIADIDLQDNITKEEMRTALDIDILTSPTGNRYKLSVDDNGILSTTLIQESEEI